MSIEKMGSGSLEKELNDVESQEIKEWKELYGKINARQTLEAVKKINDIDFKTSEEDERWAGVDEHREGIEWDGSMSFWGTKRMMMMLFDPNRESNEVFLNLSPEAQEEVSKINIEELYKEK